MVTSKRRRIEEQHWLLGHVGPHSAWHPHKLVAIPCGEICPKNDGVVHEGFEIGIIFAFAVEPAVERFTA